MTGKKFTPDYVKRRKVETIVHDSQVNQIDDDLSDGIGEHAGTEAHGMIFVKNVSDAYELGTKRRGEDVLDDNKLFCNFDIVHIWYNRS